LVAGQMKEREPVMKTDCLGCWQWPLAAKEPAPNCQPQAANRLLSS
jgi:hypothetical protein